MNTSQLMMQMLLATAFIGCSAQGPNDKLKRDVTYSTHNYKHPNKAAQASKWQQSPGIAVKAPDPRNVASANYKQQQPGAVREGGVTVPHQPSATVADRHYKTRNWMKAEPKPAVAKKPDSTGPTTGN